MKRIPHGIPTAGDFEMATVDIPAPAPGEVLVRNLWLTVDPYMRGRMTGKDSYVPGWRLGQTMEGGAIGRIVAGDHPKFKTGDMVRSSLGWREAFLSNGKGLEKVDVAKGPPQAFIGALGMPGLTAYTGLLIHGRPKEGETVFVSGAAGAVGSIVCQIAKIKGCRVIASAGSKAKIDWLKDVAKVDAAIDYRATPDLPQALAAAAPDGIDIYFDNVGGSHLEAAIGHMRMHGRIAMCGSISRYNDDQPKPGPNNLFLTVARRLTIEGFIVSDHWDRMGEFLDAMAGWIAEGRMHWQETVVDGLAAMPDAFVGLFRGDNIGKMLVRLPQ
ncbi:MAG TPA: NADP-dependent oxidoreductase [Dongiaceae bacterium]